MKRLFSIVVLAVLSSYAFAQNKIFVKDGVAINGYDAVAYFTEGKPVKGNESFSLKSDNSTWLFSSKENLEKFKNDQDKYKPQFGGFCAFGMSRGYTAPTEPDAFTIVNDKLYLNYNLQVKEEWSKDRDNLIKKADENWVGLKNK